MKFLKKVDFKPFEWLDFDNLPNSNGAKFELYNDQEITISSLILQFYSMFGKFKDDIILSQYGVDNEWGDFCLDTWDIKQDKYDYSPANKSLPTANYLQMLIDNEIEPTYSGSCKCLNWDKFLPIVLECIIGHQAPYSLMLYDPSEEFVLYFHHTMSFGVYYKNNNQSIQYILDKSEDEGLEMKNIG